jgi:hypothetical protein
LPDFSLALRHRNARLAALTCLLLLGAGLRVIGMTQADIWFDEGFTYYALKVPNVFEALLRDDHPPTYFALLKLWTAFAGQSELGLRYLSALLAMLCLALMYPLAQEVSKHRAHPTRWALPVLAVFVFTLLDMQQYIAQEARMYALVVLFAMVSMWAFLRWVRVGGRAVAVLWVVATAFCVYTHYLGAWTGVTQGVYALLFLRGRKRLEAIAGLLIAALAFSPWLLGAVLPYQLRKVSNQPIGTPSDWNTVKGFIDVFLSRQWVLMAGLMAFGGVVVVADATRPQGYRLQWKPFRMPFLLVLWILLPFWLTYFFNQWVYVLADHRLAHFDVPIALLIAYGLANVPRPARGVLLAVLLVYSVLHFDIFRPRQPWSAFGRDSAEFVVEGDAVLIDVGGGDYQLEYYIDRYAPVGTDVRSVKRWQAWYPDAFWFELPAYLDGFNTVWFARWSAFELAPIVERLGFVQTAVRRTPDWEQNWDTYRYDRLPEGAPLATFGEGLRLRHLVAHPDRLRVDLWWVTDVLLERDYVFSAFLLDESGAKVAQYDSPPFVGELPTTRWQVGASYYDPRPLQANGTLSAGVYRVGVSVYEWTPDRLLHMQPQGTRDDFAIVGELVLQEARELE